MAHFLKLKFILFFAVLFLNAENLFAQNSEADAPAVKVINTTTVSGGVTKTATERKERKAELNFEDELVEGSTQKPELFYLFQKKNFNYKRLIKLRENFLPEMRRSAEDVHRVRGGN